MLATPARRAPCSQLRAARVINTQINEAAHLPFTCLGPAPGPGSADIVLLISLAAAQTRVQVDMHMQMIFIETEREKAAKYYVLFIVR